MQGKVKWFNDQKGFGFIEPDEKSKDGKDVFCHYSAIVSDDIRRKLVDGQRVKYEIEEGEKGPQATNVQIF